MARLLPYVTWESPQAAADFRPDVKSLGGEQGVTEAMLEEWAGKKNAKAAPKRGARKAAKE